MRRRWCSNCLRKLLHKWQSSRIKTRSCILCEHTLFQTLCPALKKHPRRCQSYIFFKKLKSQGSPTRRQKDKSLWTLGGGTKLNQYGKTPDTNYPGSRKGRFLPTDGNQLATWLPENTWAAVWSQDANEAEGKVEADLPTSWEKRN